MTGIPLTRDDEAGLWYQEPKADPTHLAFPLAEVEELIDRDTRDNEWAEAITAVFPWEIDGDESVMGCVANHVSNLASLYEEMIDPNDPAVRERIAQLAEDIDPVHPVAIFDAVLAALRGAK